MKADSRSARLNNHRDESPCRTRSPGSLRMAPINRFEQVAELRRRDRNYPVGGPRPDEATPLEPLGVKRQPEPIVPKDLDQIASPSSEDVKIAGMGIPTKGFLDLQRQPIHAAPHIGHPGRQPDPDTRRNRDHRRSRTWSTRARAAASTLASTMMRRPFATTI